MVSLALTRYQAFNYSKSLLDQSWGVIHRPAHGSLDHLKKIGEVVLKALAFIPYLGADLIMIPLSSVYCCLKPKTSSSPTPPDPLNTQKKQPRSNGREGKIPDAFQIGELNRSPYIPLFLSNQSFFSTALIAGLSFLRPKQSKVYTECLLNDGVPDEGEAPVNIFQWAAGCLIAYYLRIEKTSLWSLREIFPSAPLLKEDNLSENQTDEAYTQHLELSQKIRSLRGVYDTLDRKEKAAAICQIIHSEIDWQLTEEALKLVYSIQEFSLLLCQDQNYLKDIYAPEVQLLKKSKKLSY